MAEIFGAWVSVSISGTKRKRVFIADPKMTVDFKECFPMERKCKSFMSLSAETAY